MYDQCRICLLTKNKLRLEQLQSKNSAIKLVPKDAQYSCLLAYNRVIETEKLGLALVLSVAGTGDIVASGLELNRLEGNIAGLGNIYVCEVLFRAGVHPARQAADTNAPPLVPIIRAVLSEALEAGGSSLRDYRQADGELGYFQHSFQVYGREGAPCLTPGCQSTIARIVQSGRSSVYCPACQT